MVPVSAYGKSGLRSTKTLSGILSQNIRVRKRLIDIILYVESVVVDIV
jgi:hypothetical protein